MSFGIVAVHGSRAGLRALQAVSAYDFRSEYPVVITMNDKNRFGVYGFRGPINNGNEHDFLEFDLDELAGDESEWAIAKVYNKKDRGPYVNKRIGRLKGIAVVGNGKIMNSERVIRELEDSGHIFTSNNPPYGEILAHRVSQSKETGIIDVIHDARAGLEGAYSFFVLSEHGMVALTDPHKHFPLCAGKTGDGYVFSSDTDGLEELGADFYLDIKPLVTLLSRDGEIISDSFTPERYRHCLRQASFISSVHGRIFEGLDVGEYRRRCGRTLYERHKELIEGLDVIGPLNSSAVMAFYGIRDLMKKPGHGFIADKSPQGQLKTRKELREVGMETAGKHKAVGTEIKGRRVGVVALTLSGESERNFALDALRKGAKEIHFLEPGPLIGEGCGSRSFWKPSASFKGDESEVKRQLLHIISDGGKNPAVKSINALDIKPALELTGNPRNYCTDCFCGGSGYLYSEDI